MRKLDILIYISKVLLTVQNLLLSFRALDLRDVAWCVKQAEFAAAVETLVHTQSSRVDAERRRLLRDDQVEGLLGFWLRGCLCICGRYCVMGLWLVVWIGEES